MKKHMPKTSKLAIALELGGQLHIYTVLLWLNNLAVSDIKETLKGGDDERGSQEAW